MGSQQSTAASWNACSPTKDRHSLDESRERNGGIEELTKDELAEALVLASMEVEFFTSAVRAVLILPGALSQGEVGMVKELIAARAPLNMCDPEFGGTAMMWGSSSGCVLRRADSFCESRSHLGRPGEPAAPAIRATHRSEPPTVSAGPSKW